MASFIYASPGMPAGSPMLNVTTSRGISAAAGGRSQFYLPERLALRRG